MRWLWLALTTVTACLQGVRRPALPDYLDVKKCFAVHECGKALVATTLRDQTGRLEQVERVSIVPRGRSAAVAMFDTYCPLLPSPCSSFLPMPCSNFLPRPCSKLLTIHPLSSPLCIVVCTPVLHMCTKDAAALQQLRLHAMVRTKHCLDRCVCLAQQGLEPNHLPERQR